MGSFHSLSEMELEEHKSEDICFTPSASHIEEILRKDLHGWMFDDWVIGLREDNYVNRPFPSFENSLFQKEAMWKTFLVKMRSICMRVKNHFHNNGFALGLALKQRLEATRKWPIDV